MLARTAAWTAATNPLDSVKSFFQSGTWQLIVLLFWFLLGIIWLACAYWVFKDARRRIDDPIVVGVAVLTGLIFGPLGAFVYTIVRPPEYLSDVRERELELEVLERRLADMQVCPYCQTDIREDYLVCPSCMTRLRGVCRTCRRPIEPGWRICPYCETQIAPGGSAAYSSGPGVR